MSIIIDDENTCKVCGAYWQGNGYCCNGHPRAKQMKEDEPEPEVMDESEVKVFIGLTKIHSTIAYFIIDLKATKEEVLTLVDAEYDLVYLKLNENKIKVSKKKPKKKAKKKSTKKKANKKKVVKK